MDVASADAVVRSSGGSVAAAARIFSFAAAEGDIDFSVLAEAVAGLPAVGGVSSKRRRFPLLRKMEAGGLDADLFVDMVVIDAVCIKKDVF